MEQKAASPPLLLRGHVGEVSTHAPDSVARYVIEEITQAILDGRLGPGIKLSPHRLAEELKVSHIPVREGLASLEASGHVRRENRRGFFVTEMSIEDIRDIHRWRHALESEAHRIAVPQLTGEDLKRQKELYQVMTRALKDQDPAAFAEANRAFHFVVFQRVDSERLIRFLTSLWDASIRYHNLRLHTKGEMRVIQEQHRRILEAFSRRDSHLVNRLSLEHTSLTLDLMEETLPSMSR